MVDSFSSLILMCMAMFIASMFFASVPLLCKMNKKTMNKITVFGAGVLVGTALVIIIPEGVHMLLTCDAAAAGSSVAAASAASATAASAPASASASPSAFAFTSVATGAALAGSESASLDHGSHRRLASLADATPSVDLGGGVRRRLLSSATSSDLGQDGDGLEDALAAFDHGGHNHDHGSHGSAHGGHGSSGSSGSSGSGGGHGGHDHGGAGGKAHGHGDVKLIGWALTMGFLFQLCIDRINGSHGHGHSHGDHGDDDDDGDGYMDRPGTNVLPDGTVVNIAPIGGESKVKGGPQMNGSALVGLVVHSAADGVALGASSFSKSGPIEMIVFMAIMLHKAPASFGLRCEGAKGGGGGGGG